MKNAFLVIIASVILFSAVGVLAEDVSSSTLAGTTPDSSFYFLKVWKEKIQLFFTFKAENKVQQYLHLADVRLAEYQKMMERGKDKIAQKTLEKYQAQLDRAAALAEKLQLKREEAKNDTEKEDVLNNAKEKITNQIQVLQKNINKVPEATRKGLGNALERISNIINDKDSDNEENEEGETDEADEVDEADGVDKERGCINSGGRAVVSSCCKSAEDFSNMCLIGVCGCSPDNSEETKVCDCGPDKCFNGETCVAVGE